MVDIKEGVLATVYYISKDSDGKRNLGYDSVDQLKDASIDMMDKVKDAYRKSEKLN